MWERGWEGRRGGERWEDNVSDLMAPECGRRKNRKRMDVSLEQGICGGGGRGGEEEEEEEEEDGSFCILVV